MADKLDGRRMHEGLLKTADAILSGTYKGGGTGDLSEGVGGLLKQMNTAANVYGRKTSEGDKLIRAALKLRQDNPREFRGRGVRRR